VLDEAALRVEHVRAQVAHDPFGAQLQLHLGGQQAHDRAVVPGQPARRRADADDGQLQLRPARGHRADAAVEQQRVARVGALDDHGRRQRQRARPEVGGRVPADLVVVQVQPPVDPVALQRDDHQVGAGQRLERLRQLRHRVAAREADRALHRQQAGQDPRPHQRRDAAGGRPVGDPRRGDVDGLQPQRPGQGALQLGIAHPRGGHVDGDDALAAGLGQQARHLGHRGADQRRDVRLALVLEVVQVGHPAQQLVLFVRLGLVGVSGTAGVYHQQGLTAGGGFRKHTGCTNLLRILAAARTRPARSEVAICSSPPAPSSPSSWSCCP
jgi:hypothetical protein